MAKSIFNSDDHNFHLTSNRQGDEMMQDHLSQLVLLFDNIDSRTPARTKLILIKPKHTLEIRKHCQKPGKVT